MITNLAHNVVHLFYDDRSLAIGVLLVVGTTYLCISEFQIEPLLAGFFLVAGTVMALVLGTLRARPPGLDRSASACVKDDRNA